MCTDRFQRKKSLEQIALTCIQYSVHVNEERTTTANRLLAPEVIRCIARSIHTTDNHNKDLFQSVQTPQCKNERQHKIESVQLRSWSFSVGTLSDGPVSVKTRGIIHPGVMLPSRAHIITPSPGKENRSWWTGAGGCRTPGDNMGGDAMWAAGKYMIEKGSDGPWTLTCF